MHGDPISLRIGCETDDGHKAAVMIISGNVIMADHRHVCSVLGVTSPDKAPELIMSGYSNSNNKNGGIHIDCTGACLGVFVVAR